MDINDKIKEHGAVSDIEALKKKQYTAIIKSEEYKNLLRHMSRRIVAHSKSAPNEATIENYFDCELFVFFRELFEPLGFEYNPVKEAAISTKRHVSKGRADTILGACVIEFKQPSTLATDKLQKKAIAQITNYI